MRVIANTISEWLGVEMSIGSVGNFERPNFRRDLSDLIELMGLDRAASLTSSLKV